MQSSVKLIVGLGNPGKEYERTRHNAGFMVVDALVKSLHATWKHEPKLRSMVAEAHIGDTKVVFAKPTTYMNASGEAVRLVSDFLHIAPNAILVVSDDIDLPLGHIRFRTEGGAGGHNGLKSLIACFGTQQFSRVKIGVDAPPPNVPLEAYVLQRFHGHEHDVIDRVVAKAVEILSEPSALQETTWTV